MKGLHPLYLPYYHALCDMLSDSWQPISGLRTFDEQAKLYAQGRTEPGLMVTRARPGMSFHNYGLATDWDFFEGSKYSPLGYEDERWDEYENACEKVGLVTLSWERPHNQLTVKYPIRDILAAYNRGGMVAVNVLLGDDNGNFVA